MNGKSTGFKDTNGNMIFVGDDVWLEGNLYEVIINDFGGYFAINSDLGQGELSEVYDICTKA